MNEQFILSLVDKFSAGNLGELDIQEGDLHIQLRKESAPKPPTMPIQGEAQPIHSTQGEGQPLPLAQGEGHPVPLVQGDGLAQHPTAPAQPIPSAQREGQIVPLVQGEGQPIPAAQGGALAQQPTAPAQPAEVIPSPIVATFYASSSPGTPPFASPGTLVKAGDTLCILEAMKMMNNLEAEFDGEILSVLVENGDMVEYGQGLFEIRRI